MPTPTSIESIEDDAIRSAVKRLSRPNKSGGATIERAAILAEGATSSAILTWITDHAGKPEELVTAASAGRGLHNPRLQSGNAVSRQPPLRYVLPAGALS